MTWSLTTYTHNGTTGVAVLRDDGALVAPVELKRWASLLELVGDWPAAEGVLRGLDVEGAPAAAHDTLLAPLRWPRKVVCAGVNYRRHMREMGGEIPAEGWRPFFFLKAPTTSVIGPYDPIVVRSPERARYDWEAELAVVIGVGGRDIGAGDALAHVAGYCVANDVTARGHLRRATVPAEAFTYDWFAARSMDGSLPLGPGITPASRSLTPRTCGCGCGLTASCSRTSPPRTWSARSPSWSRRPARWSPSNLATSSRPGPRRARARAAAGTCARVTWSGSPSTASAPWRTLCWRTPCWKTP